MWAQRTITLAPRKRGCHLITRDVERGLPELARTRAGVLHVFLQHTSASLTLNENASPDVRVDLAAVMDRLVPEGDGVYTHDDEGRDDMPAHAKCSLLGASLSIPVGNGGLLLGTWQGIYLNEHRDAGGPRRVVLTLMGAVEGGGS
jgi:secondary thiamine-phosphate synthase enzyme